MDNKIDWSLAPEWAVKYGIAGYSKYPVWFNNEKYEYLHDGKVYRYSDGCTYGRHEIELICERPKQWSGPQDGLPPVSSVVMARRSDNNQWIKCEVLKHGIPGQASRVCAFMEIKTNRMFWSNVYEAVKTEEQISHDIRESKIVEFMNTVGIDCRVTATKAVDAGYVLEVG